jgi:fluoride exporter
MPGWLLAALGSACGGLLRYALGHALLRNHVSAPWHTFVINVLGSFAIGCIVARWPASPLRTLLATGICGGFTTFSAFSLENIELLEQGRGFTALLYSVASVCLSALACWCGLRLLR